MASGIQLLGFGEAMAASSANLSFAPEPVRAEEFDDIELARSYSTQFSWNNPLLEIPPLLEQMKDAAPTSIDQAVVRQLELRFESARALEKSFGRHPNPQQRRILVELAHELKQAIGETGHVTQIITTLDQLERELRKTVFALRQHKAGFDVETMDAMADRRDKWADELSKLRAEAVSLRTRADNEMRAAIFATHYQLLTKKIKTFENMEHLLFQATHNRAMARATFENLKAHAQLPKAVLHRWGERVHDLGRIINEVQRNLIATVERIEELQSRRLESTEEAQALDREFESVETPIVANVARWQLAIGAVCRSALNDNMRQQLAARLLSASELIQTLSDGNNETWRRNQARLADLAALAKTLWIENNEDKNNRKKAQQIISGVQSMGALIELLELHDLARRNAQRLNQGSDGLCVEGLRGQPDVLLILRKDWESLANRIKDRLQNSTNVPLKELHQEAWMLLQNTHDALSAKEIARKQSAPLKVAHVGDMYAQGFATAFADAERMGLAMLTYALAFDPEKAAQYTPFSLFETWVKRTNNPGSDDPEILESFWLTQGPWALGSIGAITTMAVGAAKFVQLLGEIPEVADIRSSDAAGVFRTLTFGRLTLPKLATLGATGIQRWGTGYREHRERGDSISQSLTAGLNASIFGLSTRWPIPLALALLTPPAWEQSYLRLSIFERFYGGSVHSSRFAKNGHELREVEGALSPKVWANVTSGG